MDQLTVEEFKNSLPDKLRRGVTPEVAKNIVDTLNDPDMHETYRENLLTYSYVLQEGKFRMENYISAVKYVSQKLTGKTNKDAFFLTFPEKQARWAAEGVAEKDQASYITAYHKSKLVSTIMEQAIIPTWILNQDLYQKALNVQAELMQSANSEKVRCEAANSILTHLKAPETIKVKLDTTARTNSVIEQLRQTTMQLAEQQRLTIASGVQNAQQVAHSPVLIEGEATREQ